MKILLDIIILAVGFLLLIKGADIFVDGSAGIAKNYKVPGVIIGLTIVALGTSAPELAVSTVAAIKGSNEIALSNVVGSNIFNLLMVLGVCAVIHNVPVDRSIIKRDFPVSIVMTVFVLAASGFKTLTSGKIFHPYDEETSGAAGTEAIKKAGSPMLDDAGIVSRIIGAILIICFIVYIIVLIKDAKKNPDSGDESELMSKGKCVIFMIIGIAMIIGGGECVVGSAKAIAKAAGMSETLIGLTIVAVGTSLPELVTSIVAAGKGETAMAVGNVVGSNIFNLMFILGISSVISPVTVNLASIYDMIILILLSIFVYLIVIKKKMIGRASGMIMILLYVADVVFAALR